jgi:hypothetical protein
MPLARVPLTGSLDVAMANVSLENKVTFDNSAGIAPVTFTFNELQVTGLPSLMYWVRLDTPVANVVWNPMFAITNVTTGGITAPNWHPFTNGFVLVPGNVTTFFVRAAVGTAGMTIGVPAGTSVTVTTVISAGG